MTVPRNHILVGDAFEQLQQLPDSSIDMVLTSPPYFRLRDYQVQGQLGLEDHIEQWVAGLRTVTRVLQRSLLPTGTFWLNLADSYALHPSQGAAKKSLLLGPERLSLALLEDGWLLRNKIIWAKTNSMPSSVRDRLTCSYELIYVFARSKQYFFDLDSVRLPHTSQHHGRLKPGYRRPPAREVWRGPNADTASGLQLLKARGVVGHPLGKNPGDVWRLASSHYQGAHRATFPINLAERAIRAGSPESRCSHCLLPWKRQLLRSADGTATRSPLGPTCRCNPDREPAVVLDPFFGAGTTAVAAEQLGRDWLGIELNPDFAALADDRILTSRPARAGPERATA